jgi:NADPH:quinone reductase-like Zn-dependent oxidoreductase
VATSRIKVIEAVKQGKIAPTIGRTVPLSEAIQAIIELEKSGLPSGKLVTQARTPPSKKPSSVVSPVVD